MKKIKLFLLNFKNKKKMLFLGSSFFLVILVLLIVFISSSFASLVPIESISIKSESLDFDNGEVGSWQVTESAKWTSKNKVELNLDVDTKGEVSDVSDKDYIFLLGISEMLDNDELNVYRNFVFSSIESILSKGCRVSIVSFDDSYSILNDFTNDLDVIYNSFGQINFSSSINYVAALFGIGDVLENHTNEDNRRVEALLFTNSYPDLDITRGKASYNIIKDLYPNLEITAVQCGLKSNVIEELKGVSDRQYVFDKNDIDGMYQKVFTDSSYYSKFEISNLINDAYFNIDSIEALSGEVVNDNNNLVWNLGNTLISGLKASMKINLSLKDVSVGDRVFPISSGINISSTFNDVVEEKESSLTPIVADNYMVIYDSNIPTGCIIKGDLPANEHYQIFDTVEIKNSNISCEGYRFRGFKVVEDNVKLINDDYFKMPASNVTLRAEWSKLTINKSMSGGVYEAEGLYKLIAAEAVLDNQSSQYVSSSSGIDFTQPASDTNGKGVYEFSKTSNEAYPVYYYRGEVNNNNVLFGGFCWQIVRTVETGGIKLLFNGFPVDNTCPSKPDIESASIGKSLFNENLPNDFSSVGYFHGDSYYLSIYDAEVSGLRNFIYGNDVEYKNGVYTLKDTFSLINYHDDYQKIAKRYHYTCLSTQDTCSSVYYILFVNYRIDGSVWHLFDRDEFVYLTLTGGENIDNARENMFSNNYSSTIHTYLSEVLAPYVSNYSSYLDYPTWCFDRGFKNALFSKDFEIEAGINALSVFDSAIRLMEGRPSLECSNPNDTFNDEAFGLFTLDEWNLAGGAIKVVEGGFEVPQVDLYFSLQGEGYWWLMTPAIASILARPSAIPGFLASDANLNFNVDLEEARLYVRPTIVIRGDIMPTNGDGSNDKPYVIE